MAKCSDIQGSWHRREVARQPAEPDRSVSGVNELMRGW